MNSINYMHSETPCRLEHKAAPEQHQQLDRFQRLQPVRKHRARWRRCAWRSRRRSPSVGRRSRSTSSCWSTATERTRAPSTIPSRHSPTSTRASTRSSTRCFGDLFVPRSYRWDERHGLFRAMRLIYRLMLVVVGLKYVL